jgi:hypothetical protein
MAVPAALVLSALVISWASDGRGAVAATLYVSPTGSDSGPCSEAAPCASFARAYALASPGTVVEVGAGTYARQTVRYESAKAAGPPVTFRASADARLDIGSPPGHSSSGLEIVGAQHLVFENLHVVGELRVVPTRSKPTPDVRYPENIAFKGGRVDGFFTIRGVNGISFSGTTIGNYALRDANPKINGVPKVGNYPGQPDARNVVFSGVRFENLVRPPGTRTHAECLFLDGGITGLRITRSRFTNCAVFDIFVFRANGRTATDVVIENNWLDAPRDTGGKLASTAIAFKEMPNPQPVAERWRIRFNSLRGNILFKCTAGNGCESAWRDVVVSSNVGVNAGFGSCVEPGTEGVTFIRNIWTGKACSSSDRKAELGFVDPDGFDFRLVRNAPAIGFGDPEDAPASDVDSRIRPAELAPDAGGSQREPAIVVAGRAVGSARIGAPRADIVSFYGAPRKRTTQRLANDDRLMLHEYRIRGGLLRIGYVEDLVVLVSTTSPFYRTLRGVVAGESRTSPTKKGGAVCRHGSPGLYLRPSVAKPTVVAELMVVGRGVIPPCAVPKAPKG